MLNASYEPLSVVSDRRAVVLVLTDKADVVADTGAVLHAADIEVPVPSVVRLRYFVRVPFERRASLNRRAVFARDDHACQYCGRPADSLDHIVPRSRGASTCGRTWSPPVGPATWPSGTSCWRTRACDCAGPPVRPGA